MHDDEEEALRPDLCWMSHEGVYHYAIPDKPDEFSDISGGGDFDNYWNTEDLFEKSVWDIADAYEELRTLGFFEESCNLREEDLLYPMEPVNTCRQSSGKHSRSQHNTNADLVSSANTSETINDAHSKENDLISHSIACQTVSESTAEANENQYATEPAINQSERLTHGRQQYTHLASKAWTLVEGLSNGPPIGHSRIERNSRGYPLDKEIWSLVGGCKQQILRIPYIKEKFLDKARNARFEESRNPTRSDIHDIAGVLINEIVDAGIVDANLVLVPRRISCDMQSEPMGYVAKAIELMSGGRFRLNNFLRRSKSTSPPSRTSIFDQQPDSDLTKVFSGVDEIILSGIPRKISRFAGNSNFIERLDEYGLGRNRTISEDYGTLTWQDPPPPGSVVVLLDDSVGQGTSLFAATLAVHQAVPAAHVSPLTYWAFANAPLRPKMSLTSSNRVSDVIQADAEQLANAVNSHYDMARDFVHKAEIYVQQAERVMRDDPVGNWLGGLLRGQSDYDQYKARQFLMRFLPDLRQREIAVKIAASNVDSSNKAFHQRLLYELTHDPAGYRQ